MTKQRPDEITPAVVSNAANFHSPRLLPNHPRRGVFEPGAERTPRPERDTGQGRRRRIIRGIGSSGCAGATPGSTCQPTGSSPPTTTPYRGTTQAEAGWSTLNTELLPHGTAFAPPEEARLEGPTFSTPTSTPTRAIPPGVLPGKATARPGSLNWTSSPPLLAYCPFLPDHPNHAFSGLLRDQESVHA